MIMKKTIYNIFSLVFTAAALFSAVSCEQEKPLGNTEDPNFPKLVEDHDVVPGTVLTLTIQPDAAWSISVNKESYTWFKIKDGRFDKQMLAGVGLQEPKEITIWTTAEESFDLRSCEVTLTVKGKSKVIARYTLRAKAKTIETYKASRTEDGAFIPAEDEYVYEQAPIADEDEIELVWDNNDRRFYFPVKVIANYDWTVEWPSWARADINVDSKVGETRFQIYGIPSELPLEDTIGDIVFKDKENAVDTIMVKIPGCKDIFNYSLGGFTSLTFDHAQYFHNGAGSFTKEPVQGNLYGPASARVVVFEMTENGYVVPQSPWLNVEVAAWDSVEGADVLQSREINITAPTYSGKTDRSALVLFLPATAPKNVDELLSGDRMTVKEEYSTYAVTALQTACPEEYFTFEETAEDMRASGLLFEKTSGLLADKAFSYADGCSEWQYNMSYVKEIATTKAPFYITYPYETIAVYDADGVEILETELSEYWLKYEALGDGLYGQVVMDMSMFTKKEQPKPKEIDGYIVFKNEVGRVLAVLHCFYKEEEKTDEDVLKDVSSYMFINPVKASEVGATIHYLESGPTYEIYKEHQAPIYVITYTKDNTSLDVRTDRNCTMYQCVGKQYGPEMVTVDRQVFHDYDFDVLIDKYNEDLEKYKKGEIALEPKYPDPSKDKSTQGLLKFGSTAQVDRPAYMGYSELNMKMLVDSDNNQEVILFSTDSAIKFVFICILDLQ